MSPQSWIKKARQGLFAYYNKVASLVRKLLGIQDRLDVLIDEKRTIESKLKNNTATQTLLKERKELLKNLSNYGYDEKTSMVKYLNDLLNKKKRTPNLLKKAIERQLNPLINESLFPTISDS